MKRCLDVGEHFHILAQIVINNNNNNPFPPNDTDSDAFLPFKLKISF